MKHTVTGKQPNSKMCGVCGLDNSASMKAKFYNLDNGETAAIFTPTQQHQGYPDRLHGGFATALLDELIGRAVNSRGGDIWSVTMEITVKFRKPVPLGKPLRAVGRVTKNGTRVLEGTGEIFLEDGKVAVEASARYMKLPMLDPEAAGELGWRVIPQETDPKEIELP